MLLTLFLLAQPQSTKLGWYVWAIAIFFFVLGLGLLIYVMTRPKLAQDDEVEVTAGGLFNVEKRAAEAAAEDAEDDESEQLPPTDAVLSATNKDAINKDVTNEGVTNEPGRVGDVTRPLAAVREPAPVTTLPSEPEQDAKTAANETAGNETRPLASVADEVNAAANTAITADIAEAPPGRSPSTSLPCKAFTSSSSSSARIASCACTAFGSSDVHWI